MRLFYILKKIKYFPLLILLILISIFAVPGYTKGVGEFFSSKVQVTWDDGGLNSIEKRAYVFLKNQESTLRYDDTNRTLSTNYGCLTHSSSSGFVDYLVNPGLDAPHPKGWYHLVQSNGLDNSNLHWGTATISWGTEDYEKNCEYEYVYLPGSAPPISNKAAEIDGDIYSEGEIVGKKDPNIPDDDYIAIAGDYLIESAADITRIGPGKVRQVGFYTLKDTSTSQKNIINTFYNKLIGSPKSFISEYHNVQYGKNTISNLAKDFYISNINNKLTAKTDLAKNPDGDVYVIEGDLTIDQDIDLLKNARKLVYVKGDLNIKANIYGPNRYVPTGSTNWEQLTAENDSAVLAFVVEGDITVDGGTEDVDFIHAGLIAIGDPTNPNPNNDGTITFKHLDDTCTTNPCHELQINKGLVIGRYVEFKRDPAKINFSEGQSHAGVYIKYNPNIAKLPAFDQLLSAPAIDEASP